jgi:hypothetical protein
MLPTVCPEAPESVYTGHLVDAIDHQDVDWSFFRFEAKTELPLQRLEERRTSVSTPRHLTRRPNET